MIYQNAVYQLYFFSRNMMQAGALSIQIKGLENSIISELTNSLYLRV
jgi:hypothetical protein